MEQLLATHGLPALFCRSFLAATLVPIGSEWLLVTLLLKHHDPALAVWVATAGNFLGACTTYAVGMWGGPFLVRKVLRIDAATERRAEDLYASYGSWSLLFSWLPVIGDPLCLIGGILRTGFARFSLLVASGKLARYAFIAWATVEGM